MNLSLMLTVIVSEIILIGIFSPSDFAYGQSDLYLEIKVNREPSEIVWNVTNSTVSGESGKEICPSGKCKITDEKNPHVYPPNPDNMALSYGIDFRLQDNITNAKLGPLKKEFMEQFSAGLSVCRVNDIIEENGQELYYCHGQNTIGRSFDSKTWYYDASGIYDAKNLALKVYGNFTTRVPPYSLQFK